MRKGEGLNPFNPGHRPFRHSLNIPLPPGVRPESKGLRPPRIRGIRGRIRSRVSDIGAGGGPPYPPGWSG